MKTPTMAPFWGVPTSYLNFCEEARVHAQPEGGRRQAQLGADLRCLQDYAVTRYVAEFINILSSLVFVAYGVGGLSRVDPGARSSSRLVAYLGLIGVGICSVGYHMTLKYHTQMSDEFSMHLLTTPIVYRLLAFKATPGRTKLVNLVLVFFTTVMITHMVMDEFLLHTTTFGLAVYVIAIRVHRIIPQKTPDPSIRRKLRNLAMCGSANFAFGYLLWLMERWACNALVAMRHSVGLPAAFLLELHGWWHVFTAVGGYIAVAVVDAITSGEVHHDSTESLAWPIPLVARLISGSSRPAKQSQVRKMR